MARAMDLSREDPGAGIAGSLSLRLFFKNARFRFTFPSVAYRGLLSYLINPKPQGGGTGVLTMPLGRRAFLPDLAPHPRGATVDKNTEG